MAPNFRFDRFRLDPRNRQLSRDGAPVDLNARYLDALALLVGEAGQLVPKDRFLDQVWRGVPVTDEALTQCIKMLRRQLGDSAASPRFIETVPKHGYRFIAPVEVDTDAPPPGTQPRGASHDWRQFVASGLGATIGGGIAGLIGGLVYGLAGAAQPLAPAMGATSVLLVLLCLNIIVGVTGGIGVGLGIAAARVARSGPGPSSIVGGALGGLVVGALAKLLGLDAFSLLIGQTPGDITGAGEGALLGGAVGLGIWLAQRGALAPALGRTMVAAGLTGGSAGLIIPLLGGRLMGGSLDQLARHVPGSRLRLDHIGSMFGEPGFGVLSQTVTGAMEGALFGACLAGAMILALRDLAQA